MKKIITVIAIFVFSFSALLAKNNHNYQEGDIVENSLEFEQGKYKIPLPDGKWEIGVLNIFKSKNTSTKIYELGLFQFEKNLYKNYLKVAVSARVPTKWKTPKFCKRKNVYFNRAYTKGSAYNCWMVNHWRISLSSNKIKGFNLKVRDFIVKRNIKTPGTAIMSQHQYSSKRQKNRLFYVQWFTNPELSGLERDDSGWDESTYQKIKVIGHPKKKQFLDERIKITAAYQKRFEEEIGVLDGQKLNLSDILIQTKEIKKIEKKQTDSKSVVDQLKELSELQKSGVISKEEFEKAKAKLLK